MMHRSKQFSLINIFVAAAILVLLTSVNVNAQLPTPDYSGSLWTRSTLTGDWGCARNELAKKGITFRLR